MKGIISLLTIVFCLILTNDAYSKEHEDLVLVNRGKMVAYFAYTDKYGDQIQVTVPPNDVVKIIVDKPVALRNLANRNENFILLRADTLYLKFDTDGRCSMTAAHKLIDQSPAFLKLSALENSMLSASEIQVNNRLFSTPVRRDSVLFSAYKMQLSELSKNMSNDAMKKSDMEFVRKFLHYEYLTEISRHLVMKSFVNGSVPKIYRDSMLNLSSQLDCDVCLDISTYRDFAENYLTYLMSNTSVSELWGTITSRFGAKTKDFVLFKAMKNFSTSNKEVFRFNYQFFMSTCGDNDYKQYITGLYNFATLKLDVGKQNLMALDGASLPFSEVLNMHKGKLIYIDFWATWCSPCMDEIPFSIELSKQYKDKNIVFLYLSLDNNASSWKASVKRLGLDSGTNYLLVDGFKSKVAAQFKVLTIPHYVIIGESGEVLNRDASRPSEIKTSAILDKYIRKP